jgi:hypothetical protein
MFYEAHAKDVLNFVRGRWNVSFRTGCAIVVLNELPVSAVWFDLWFRKCWGGVFFNTDIKYYRQGPATPLREPHILYILCTLCDCCWRKIISAPFDVVPLTLNRSYVL